MVALNTHKSPAIPSVAEVIEAIDVALSEVGTRVVLARMVAKAGEENESLDAAESQAIKHIVQLTSDWDEPFIKARILLNQIRETLEQALN